MSQNTNFAAKSRAYASKVHTATAFWAPGRRLETILRPRSPDVNRNARFQCIQRRSKMHTTIEFWPSGGHREPILRTSGADFKPQCVIFNAFRDPPKCTLRMKTATPKVQCIQRPYRMHTATEIWAPGSRPAPIIRTSNPDFRRSACV